MKILFFVTVASPVRWVSIKTESVEMVLFISKKVVERPDSYKRYNAPHSYSRTLMLGYTICHTYTRNECYSFVQLS